VALLFGGVTSEENIMIVIVAITVINYKNKYNNTFLVVCGRILQDITGRMCKAI
jgi:hypothetical protein